MAKRMTNGVKAAMTLVLLIALFTVGAVMDEITGHIGWRLFGVLPILCLGASAMLFRWPRYLYQYFRGVSERDSQKGFVSLYSLGVAGLAATLVAVYMMLTG